MFKSKTGTKSIQQALLSRVKVTLYFPNLSEISMMDGVVELISKFIHEAVGANAGTVGVLHVEGGVEVHFYFQILNYKCYFGKLIN